VHRLLQLLERAHLDLAHALAADAVLAASSSSVAGSSFSRRSWIRMWRSRSFSSLIASCSSAMRARSEFLALGEAVSWLRLDRRPASPAIRASPSAPHRRVQRGVATADMRRFIETTSSFGTASLVAICAT
jgi:hypothetical protein